jgi:hypothetical protein
VLPSSFHRIRHYGLFGGTVRADNIERARQALAAENAPQPSREADSPAYASRDSSACASVISGISGVGEKPSSAGARVARASFGRPVDR